MSFADAQTGGKILDAIFPMQITLAESCVKGDILGYSSGWKRALATVGTAIQGKLIAGMDGKTGDVIVAYSKARLGGRLSGMTIGNPVYVAEGTSYGQYTQSAPSTTGDCNKIIGVAVADGEAIIMPNVNADGVA